jgi:hypothetical protein
MAVRLPKRARPYWRHGRIQPAERCLGVRVGSHPRTAMAEIYRPLAVGNSWLQPCVVEVAGWLPPTEEPGLPEEPYSTHDMGLFL